MIPNEIINVGFVHDILKFNFLIEVIKDEFDMSNNSLILSGILIFFL